jgi:hypothetical protein
MKNASSALLFSATALAIEGCHGALIGNVFVLMVTVGIFFGTLGLGRSATVRTRSEATRSSQRPPTADPRA